MKKLAKIKLKHKMKKLAKLLKVGVVVRKALEQTNLGPVNI